MTSQFTRWKLRRICHTSQRSDMSVTGHVAPGNICCVWPRVQESEQKHTRGDLFEPNTPLMHVESNYYEWEYNLKGSSIVWLRPFCSAHWIVPQIWSYLGQVVQTKMCTSLFPEVFIRLMWLSAATCTSNFYPARVQSVNYWTLQLLHSNRSAHMDVIFLDLLYIVYLFIIITMQSVLSCPQQTTGRRLHTSKRSCRRGGGATAGCV